MMEIERKILEIDVASVKRAILKLSPRPEKLFEGLVRINYFDFPDHRIHGKRDLLRVREFTEKGRKPFTELVYKTYKGVKAGCKYFDECEIKLEGLDRAEELG